MQRELFLPIRQELCESRNIMFVGLGGGFDIFSALPIADSLDCCCGASVVLVNHSGKSDDHYHRSTGQDYPEGLIEDVLPKEGRQRVKGVYTVGRHGVQLVNEAYRKIVEEHDIDTVIGVDGGVDSLMRGDEDNAGTVLEDFIALTAIYDLDVPHTKILACTGFGSETEEQLNHYRVLENIAVLTKQGHFLGTCSLTPDMPSFEGYQEICKDVMSNGRKSHIQTKIISAVNGEFGDYHMFKDIDARVHGASISPFFVNPLMGIYWFFNLEGVVEGNLFANSLRLSRTFTDARVLYRQNLQAMTRNKQAIPL